MTYDPNIPIPTKSPDVSASPIQVNFSQFATIFSKLSAGVIYNHMPLNDINQGKHAAVLMERQTSAPGVTQDLTVLFGMNATSAAGTQPQLFAQIPKFLSNGGLNNPMQLTYNSVNTAGPIYYSFLPGGYLFYFGTVTSSGSNPSTVTVTLSPTPTKILCAQAFGSGVSTVSGNANTPFDSWVTVTQPVVSPPSAGKILISSLRATAGSTFFWFAIAQS